MPPRRSMPTVRLAMEDVRGERESLLELVERWLDTPMLLLSLAWLGLFVLEVTRGLSPFLERVGMVLWAVFVLEFLLRLVLAPSKGAFLRRSWLTALSLLVPALRLFRAVRVLRVVRAARAARGVRVLRAVTTVNRWMRALGATMSRRGLPYVLALTAAVVLAGAAGIYALERDVSDPRAPRDFGSALWWTLMIMTTMGSEYWPQTPEGRLLCLVLSIYAFAVFGYVTASIASFFIGQDAHEDRSAQQADVVAELRALRAEVKALRAAPLDRTEPR